MPASEHPDGWYVMQQKRKVIAAEEGVKVVIPVELRADVELDGCIGLANNSFQLRAVESADQIDFISGIGRNIDHAPALRNVGLVACDHVEIQHGARGRQRTCGMIDVVIRAEKSLFLGTEDDEKQAAAGSRGGLREEPGEFHHRY